MQNCSTVFPTKASRSAGIYLPEIIRGWLSCQFWEMTDKDRRKQSGHKTVIKRQASTHGTFSRVDRTIAHKQVLIKLRRQILSSIFSEHNDMNQ